MRVVPLYAGQMRDAVVSAHHKYEAEHDTDAKVDPLVCHGGYHFPGILTGVVPLHAVRGNKAAELQTKKQKTTVKSLNVKGSTKTSTTQFK